MRIAGIDDGSPSAPDRKEQSDAPDHVAENPILDRYVWGAMHRHSDNWMGAYVGETGSGKSWAALRTAEVVDPNFDVEKVCFGVGDFLRRVNEDAPPGDMTVFEEASVEADSAQYMSIANRAIRYVSETWRHERRGAAMTLPSFGRLDSGVRGRITMLVQMDHVNENAGYSLGRCKRLEEDSWSGKLYQKYPRIAGVKHRQLKFRKPSDELLEAYEQRKADYTDELNTDLLEEYLEEYAEDKPGDPEDGTPEEPDAIAQDIVDGPGVEDYVMENNGVPYFSRDAVELDYDIGARKSGKVKTRLRQWGELDDVQ